MDIIKMLHDLRSEREQIDEAILNLSDSRADRPTARPAAEWMSESAGSTRSRKFLMKRVPVPKQGLE